MPYVSDLARMVHPRDGHPKVFAMIDAYCDESGIHDKAEVCLVGGYFGGRGQWRRLERLWERVLADSGLSAFHAKSNKGPDLQMALAEVIAKSKVYPVVNGVVVRDFFKLSMTERRFMTGATLTPAGRIKESGNPNRPYFVPFQPAINRILSYAPVGGKAHFFFGLDSTFGDYAKQLYKKLKDVGVHQYQERFGLISFPDAKDTPALQAADLLVYSVYQDMVTRLREKRLYLLGQPSDLIRLLLNNRRHAEDTVFQDENLMRETLRQIPFEQRGDLFKEDLA